VSVAQQASAAPPQPSAESADSNLVGVCRQLVWRELNEAIRQIADTFGVDEDVEVVCECERADCSAFLSVAPQDYETVRRFPTRFLIRAEHVGPDERIVQETALYIVVEKIGPSAETAILRDPRKRALQAAAA
jgi:hypothetical protein